MYSKKKIKLAVLASGSGTNLQSIIDQYQQGLLDVEIGMVISNNPAAGALERAEQAGINNICINHRDYSSREEFDRAVVATLREVGVELVVLAGFMRILSAVFLQAFPQRIINIHPALLPAFPGLHVQRQALEYGAKFSGCTVHLVDSGVDTGPIIAQAVVPIFTDDSEETLAARILEQEHKIYPQVIQWFAEDRVKIVNRQVQISHCKNIASTLINPTIDEEPVRE
ncbi:MAG: phosphoribosylglycinamide formyltransferase [Thermodesulfobacteriota bacterium]|nr:phosphoribosylglycinamide formyltransferase [Thermodesulfobacteriota bacterium]